MVGPLVEHCSPKRLFQLRDGILRDDRRAELCDKRVNAVIYLRVHMIGASRQNDDSAALLPGGGNDFHTLLSNLLHVVSIFRVGSLYRRFDLAVRDGTELPL